LKPRLTLVTHVDWGHIRQRPHQLAVALAEWYEVTVVAPVARRRAQVVDNPAPGVTLVRVWRLPGSYRSAGVAEANAVLASMQCGPQVRRGRVVVVTSPELWPWVRPSLGGRTLVYDCMDDPLAFEQDEGVRALKASWERELVAHCALVACSSEALGIRAVAQGAAASHTTVVPNGWDDESFPVQPSAALPMKGPLELAYYGTIAEWLDVDALRALAALHPAVSIRLIGPGNDSAFASMEALRVEPPVVHRKLAETVASAHALLLPFRVNDLTRGVDPVKLYEYIALGKPIASAYWPGLDRFAGFVTFYDDVDTLVELFRQRSIATPPDREARAAFLAPQSWRARARALHDAIVRAAA
jgi:teichuronic acid biosynthesis glycosyltransferase TuaH